MAEPVKKAAAKKAEPEPEEVAPVEAEPVKEKAPEPAPVADEVHAGGYVNKDGLGWVLEEE